MGKQIPEKKIWLASPLMHGDEQNWVDEAIRTNWVSTVGANINAVEHLAAELTQSAHAVALSSGTAALHLAVRRCGQRLYGLPEAGKGVLSGTKVFCSDLTFAASANPVAYEGGEAVFIDAEYATWNMDPDALERAFEQFPDVRMIVCAHLYGVPAQMDRIRRIADSHHAFLIEDAAESLGAVYGDAPTGSFGDMRIISFNGNKIITGSSGGMLLTDDGEDADVIRKWSTQSREPAPWYQHEELGYNYRMSNIIAGIVRGQIPHLGEHIAKKKAIYERYRDAFAELPLSMNPFDARNSTPNYWLSCILLDRDVVANPKTDPMTILRALADHNIEARPIWKPMHLQPLYKENPFVTAEQAGTHTTYAKGEKTPADTSVGSDIFERGLCLPSDINMTVEQQERVIGIVKECLKT